MRTPVDTALAAALTIACAAIAAPIVGASPGHLDDATSCSAADLDACDRSDQMIGLAQSGLRMVTDYLTEIGFDATSLPALIFIPSGGGAESQCVDINGNNSQHDRSWDYCSTDNTVYIGQNSLWDSYRQYGASGPLSGLAHEYGHHVQAVMGVPTPKTATEAIGNENQADCISGAFIGYRRDRPDSTHQRDLDSVERYLTATASTEGPGRDHGTARERIESFELGYAGGLPACSRFYPTTPLTAP